MDARGEWVRDTLSHEIVTKNWPQGSLVEVQLGSKSGGNAGDGGFASNTYHLVLKVKFTSHNDKNLEEERTHHLLVKVFPEDVAMRAMHSSDLQFSNETLMYESVMPSLQAEDSSISSLWPRCFLSKKYSPMLDVIVMEDLTPLGFRLANPAAALDTLHATLALQKLAHLHALAYSIKAKQPQQYCKFVEAFKETHYPPEGSEELSVMLKSTVQRGIGPLRQRPECAEYVSILNKMLTDPLSLITRIVKPKNPTTDVICHGDFCRNNILYKYSEDGRPCDLRLIDFATIRESSPACDIILFLYMSVSEDARSGPGLITLLKSYHDSLTSTLQRLGVEDPWRGQLDALVQEVGRSVLFAYCVCSFFLPVMVADASDFQMEEMMTMTEEEKIEMNLKLGGEVATSRLVNILTDIQQREFYKLWI